MRHFGSFTNLSSKPLTQHKPELPRSVNNITNAPLDSKTTLSAARDTQLIPNSPSSHTSGGIFESGGRKKFASVHSNPIESPKSVVDNSKRGPGVYNIEVMRRNSQENGMSSIKKTTNINNQTTTPKKNMLMKPNQVINSPIKQLNNINNNNNNNNSSKSDQRFQVFHRNSSKNFTRSLNYESPNLEKKQPSLNHYQFYNEINVKHTKSTVSKRDVLPQKAQNAEDKGKQISFEPVGQKECTSSRIFNQTPPPMNHRNIYVNKIGFNGNSSFYLS